MPYIMHMVRVPVLKGMRHMTQKANKNIQDLLKMNSMKLAIPLHSLYWSIHTKDESKRGSRLLSSLV